ncbi:MAG: flagellin [Lachnospiraceae bacterium]|nr:flagellin [Lachnospiraceae bacterium]
MTLSVDSVPYSYTFPENTQYTAHEFADLLNTMLQNGDDNGNTAPLKASIENGTLKLSHKVAGSHSLAINSITISQPKYAEKAVARIKNAIYLVSSRRSTYGAVQNRLEHTINKKNNVIENTQVSESAIRDADIAKETMELAKNHFMLQANQVMLAQANQLPNFILNLLK